MPRGTALWKLNEYAKSPNPNIILGDSRARGFDTDLIKEITNEQYYNFAIPGGNYKTFIDVFWYADGLTELKNVVIQVGFHNYSEGTNYDLISPAKEYMDQPYKMFWKNWFTFDSFESLKYKLRKEPFGNDDAYYRDLQMKNLANWDEVLHRQGYAVLSRYIYPEKYYNALKEISKHCRQNNISLSFVILSSHPDYYSIVEELNLSNSREKFISDINEMGKTIDYSASEKRITRELFFYDLYHLNHSVIDSLTYEIWQ